jgi:hypothetical protein
MASKQTKYENDHFKWNKVENLVIKRGIIGNDSFVMVIRNHRLRSVYLR